MQLLSVINCRVFTGCVLQTRTKIPELDLY